LVQCPIDGRTAKRRGTSVCGLNYMAYQLEKVVACTRNL